MQPIADLFNDKAKLISHEAWMKSYTDALWRQLSLREKFLFYVVERPATHSFAVMNLARNIHQGVRMDIYKDDAGKLYITGNQLARDAAQDISQSPVPKLTRKCWEIGAEVFNATPDESHRRRFMKPAI